MVNGIVITGSDVTLDDLTLEGAMDVGVEVRGHGATVHASRFERLSGTSVRLADAGASLRQNVFKSAGQSSPPAVQAIGGIAASLDSNVFMHFARVVDPATRADELVGRDNFVILAGKPIAPARSRR